MSMFDPVPYETSMEANDVIAVAAGRKPAGDVETIRGLSTMVAGAAVALEKGGAEIGRARDTAAEEWLDPNRFEGRLLQRAVGRVLNQSHAQGAELDMSPHAVVRTLVADVAIQSVASREVLRGAERPGSPLDQADREYAARGDFHEISPHGRREVMARMFEGAGVPASVAKEAVAVAAYVTKEHEGIPRRSREIMSRVADFSEHAADRRPLFTDVNTTENEPRYAAAVTRAGELMLGRGDAPSGPAELAVAAHVKGVGDVGNGRVANEARARVLLDGLPENADIGHAARTIQAEVVAVNAASREMFDRIGEAGVPPSVDKVAYARFSTLDDQEQSWTYQKFQYAEGVSPLAAVRMERAAALVQEEARDRGVQRDVGAPIAARAAAAQADRGR